MIPPRGPPVPRFETISSRGAIDAVIRRALPLQRLLLRLHDVEGCAPRLVQPQVGGDDCRQRHLMVCSPPSTSRVTGAVALHRQRVGIGRLRQPGQRRQHLARRPRSLSMPACRRSPDRVASAMIAARSSPPPAARCRRARPGRNHQDHLVQLIASAAQRSAPASHRCSPRSPRSRSPPFSRIAAPPQSRRTGSSILHIRKINPCPSASCEPHASRSRASRVRAISSAVFFLRARNTSRQ